MVLLFGVIYGSKVIVIVEVGVGVGVRGTGARGEGVDRLGEFSEPWSVCSCRSRGGRIFFRCIPQSTS